MPDPLFPPLPDVLVVMGAAVAAPAAALVAIDGVDRWLDRRAIRRATRDNLNRGQDNQ